MSRPARTVRLFPLPSARASAFVAIALGAAVAGCAPTHRVARDGSGAGGPLRAQAPLRDAAGRYAGIATLTETDGGAMQVVVRVEGMSPGMHGVHFHNLGSCATGAATFDGAGVHFNPTARQHGMQNPAGSHAGDLPNLEVGADGRGELRTPTNRAMLSAGETSLLDANGTSIVVHANTDDEVTDPSGNSGARIACGVLKRT